MSEYILENRNADESKITSYLIIFFIHIIKCKAMPNKISSSWNASINNSINALIELKSHHASFKGYDINKYIDYIKSNVYNKVISENIEKDKSIFDFTSSYEYFNSLDIIIDKNKVSKYINTKS